MTDILLGNLAIAAAAFLLLWIMSVAIKDASIVDIFWGPSMVLVAVASWLRGDVDDPRATILMLLVTIWAARLAVYLARRNLGHGEDFRYQRMREKAGSDRAFALRSLYAVYGTQLLISFLVSLPVQLGQFGASTFFGPGPGAIGALCYVGILLFLIGLFIETVGDIQLRRFKRDPANQGVLMDKGLWSWTRHPNYFGDAVVWFGLTLIALESAYGLWVIFSPFLMLYFLYALSGKGLLERMMARRYPDFADYQRRVSGFLPWPPKN